MSDELKPCPLCGGPVLIHRRTDGQVDGIVCDECLLTLETVDVYPEWHTLDELVRRWNARADRTCQMVELENVSWEKYEGVADGARRCSLCGAIFIRNGDVLRPNYCPSCGAKVVR